MCWIQMFVVVVYFFFFCKQKTAYEMRISDWSSDVCSSDLRLGRWVPATSAGTTALVWQGRASRSPHRSAGQRIARVAVAGGRGMARGDQGVEPRLVVPVDAVIEGAEVDFPLVECARAGQPLGAERLPPPPVAGAAAR